MSQTDVKASVTAKKSPSPIPARPRPVAQTARATAYQPAAALPPAQLLVLQRTMGNRAVNHLLVQRLRAVGVEARQTTSVTRVGSPLVQRAPEDETLSVAASAQQAAFEPGASFENHLATQQGRGQPLPTTVRRLMEPRFGADFSSVRVHTDAAAAQLNRAVAAQAFTHGPDIYFGAGHYQPESVAGQHLLAHELTHVVQQQAGSPGVQRLTAGVPPAHAATPVRSTVHNLTETKTNQAGAESDTGNFSHANDSAMLDRLNVTYKGAVVGAITTIGADGNTLVKMHLVNSYLNPNANNWSKNWVWGSATLNHRHNEIEEDAKAVHPAQAPTHTALNYETQADAGSRPNGVMTGDGLAQLILDDLAQLFNGVPNIVIPSYQSFKANLKIGDQSVDNFVGRWVTAVGQTATTRVVVNYRVARGPTWDAPVTDARSDVGNNYSIAFHQGFVRDLLAAQWVDVDAPRPKRIRT